MEKTAISKINAIFKRDFKKLQDAKGMLKEVEEQKLILENRVSGAKQYHGR